MEQFPTTHIPSAGLEAAIDDVRCAIDLLADRLEVDEVDNTTLHAVYHARTMGEDLLAAFNEAFAKKVTIAA